MSQQQGYKRPRTQTVVVMPRKRIRSMPATKQHMNYIATKTNKPDVKVAQIKINLGTIAGGGAAGNIYDILGGMTQGTGMRNQFIGRKINPIGLDIRYDVQQSTGNLTTNGKWNPIIRASVLQYGNQYAVNTPPPLVNIYEDLGSVHSPFELVNWEEIDCLHDAIYPLGTTVSVSATQQSGNAYTCHKYIKGKKLKPITYDDVAVAWKSGGLLFCLYGDTNTTPLPSVQAYIRLYFTDA